MSVRADAETLRAIPIFRDCEPVHLQLLAFSSERDQFAPRQTLISQGKKADAAYFVLSGTVELRSDSQKPGVQIGVAEPGSLIGEVAMIGGTNYGLTAIAREEVRVARISRELFQRVAREYPEFGAAVFRVLAQRLDQSVRDLDEIRLQIGRTRGFSDL